MKKPMPYLVSIPGKSINGKTQYHVTTTAKYQWEAIEKSKPNDYFVSVSKQETSIVIKNVYWDDEYYKDSTTTARSKTTTKKESKTNHKKTTKKLPQTGQLWWPLPFLIFGGILCIGLGMTKRKDSDLYTKR